MTSVLLQRTELAEPWCSLHSTHMVDAGPEVQQKHAASAPRDIKDGRAAMQAHVAVDASPYAAEEEQDEYEGVQGEQPASAASSFYECRSEGTGPPTSTLFCQLQCSPKLVGAHLMLSRVLASQRTAPALAAQAWQTTAPAPAPVRVCGPPARAGSSPHPSPSAVCAS